MADPEPRVIVVETVTCCTLVFDFDARTVTAVGDDYEGRDGWVESLKWLMDFYTTLSPPRLIGAQVDELAGLTGTWEGSLLNAVAMLTDSGCEIVGWEFRTADAG